MAFPHVSHRFTLVLAFWDAFWLVVFGFVCFGCVLCLFCFVRLPTLSRCRSFLPDLKTVRAVMVRTALEKTGGSGVTFLPCWFYCELKASFVEFRTEKSMTPFSVNGENIG